MKRTLYERLLQWKDKSDRKPLILNGARQVGKTYLLQDFGRREYEKMAFFSLDRNPMAASVFDNIFPHPSGGTAQSDIAVGNNPSPASIYLIISNKKS